MPTRQEGQPRTASRRQLLAASGAAGLCAAAPKAPAVAQERRDWLLATTWPEGLEGYYSVAQDLAETITTLSEGRLVVTPQPGERGPPPIETLKAVADGTYAMGHGAPYFWAHESRALQFVAGIPFGLTPREAQGWISQPGARSLVQSLYNSFDVHMLPAGNSGGKTGGWFTWPIREVAELEGKRLRIPGLGGTILRAAGARIVNRPAEAIADELSSGALDGTDWAGLADDLDFGLADTGARLHAPPWQEPSTLLDAFVNGRAWQALPDDLQAVVETAAAAVTSRSIAGQQARNARAYQRMRTELGLPPPWEIPQQAQNTLGALAGQVLTDVASQDESSRQVFDSLTSYRRQQVFWAGHGANAFLDARLLPFPYPEAGG